MSIHVYLNGEEVGKLEGFQPSHRDALKAKLFEVPGLDIWHEEGRWYTILYDVNAPVPAEVADIVEEISLYDLIPASPKRESGIYRYKSAEAEIEPDGGEKPRIQVRIRAKKMDDLRELFRSIKAGSIRPEKSYENRQISWLLNLIKNY
ncbi:MAG: minor capsid protein [bacterium]|nr:minor capsid protein [bacterium]